MGSFAIFFVIAELAYRALASDVQTTAIQMVYHDGEHREIGPEEASERGMLQALEPAPRPRLVFTPGTSFHIGYKGDSNPYLGEHGCVPVSYNSQGIREREELCAPKPPGQERILCLGDSFTIGWGIKVEDVWVRQLEGDLRRAGEDIRSINCGAAGTLFVDEYWWGLKERFKAFEPDMVLVSICLNDLLPVNQGLAHHRRDEITASDPELAWWHSRIIRDLSSWDSLPPRMRLDPSRDWTRELLDLAEDDPAFTKDVPQGTYWAGGGPQEALRQIRDWCRQREIPIATIIWPLFQGTGTGEFYPFASMHAQFSEFCQSEEIPCLDLLPTFTGHDSQSLWVNSSDYHGNPFAQRLATDAITPFVKRLLL